MFKLILLLILVVCIVVAALLCIFYAISPRRFCEFFGISKDEWPRYDR